MGSNPLHGRRLRDIRLSRYSNINARTVVAPLVAFTMAALLFVYTRSSIYAAKRNAQNHRIADGGQISWRNESQRRHGVLGKPPESAGLRGLIGIAAEREVGLAPGHAQMSKEEEALKQRKARRAIDEKDRS